MFGVVVTVIFLTATFCISSLIVGEAVEIVKKDGK